MSTVRVRVEGERIGPKFQRATTRMREQVLASIRGAAKDVSEAIVKEGSSDIGRATPNFGRSARWTKGLHAPVTEGGGHIKIGVHHDVSYWMTHEKGATIRAKNASGFLWIPLGKNMKGQRARGYPGLFRITSRKGNELLVVKKGKGIEPKFLGRRQVTIPKRFHVFEIAHKNSLKLRDFYLRRLGSGAR